MAKEKILLADDVELFLELEKTFFRREGFDLLVARTGKAAYDLTVAERPDLVMMDLYMPEMDGDEACRRLKENPQTAAIPVIMVTQGGRESDFEKCRRAGCDDILLKPINRHHLVATARKHLKIVDRGAPRVSARLKVYFGQDPPQLLSNYSVNLSTGGLFLETAEPLDSETLISLEFLLPDREAPVRCQARVAWANHLVRPKKPLLPQGVGLQFIDLKLQDLDAIREFIKGECLAPHW
ncbi:two-component system response regulator [Desulfuromonas versatilis]|uniref:Two-component system response regulator n=1 Tax=Desulfuromonas versatilis TaxID=2802975 RepID=A0ABN6DXB5_9BACT|nr:TIGR02266 family protein [Desulfuromonas versatilis]BCR04514.1 two-component system response regulator [Desulfuromonas versatilis]